MTKYRCVLVLVLVLEYVSKQKSEYQVDFYLEIFVLGTVCT